MLEPVVNEGVRRIEPLIAELEGHPDAKVRDNARELVAALLDYHREAVSRLLEIVARKGASAEATGDALVESVLLLHGLHPESPEERLARALEKARPPLRQHQGDVEMLSLEEGVLRLRLLGTCHGCPASQTTFRNLIQVSVEELVPEVETILVQGIDFEEAS